MKPFLPLAIVVLVASLCSCKMHPENLLGNKKKHYIALQPMGNYNKEQLQFISTEITRFYNKPVIILPSIPIPGTFRSKEKRERYSADSILTRLKLLTNDTIVQIVGLLHKDISTRIKDKDGNTKQPAYKYAAWGVFGLGYLPGNACVVSDNRLKIKDTMVFKHRLKTVVFHEIGHNMGLPHCPVAGCIMNDTNEKFSTIDNSNNDYCDQCKRKLKETL